MFKSDTLIVYNKLTHFYSINFMASEWENSDIYINSLFLTMIINVTLTLSLFYFRRRKVAGGISFQNSQNSSIRSSLWCANDMIKYPHYMLYIMALCLSPFGGVLNLHLVVTRLSSVSWIPLCTSSCTPITCWPLWDPKYRNICGGRNISPFCKWFNLFWWWYTPSNCSSEMTAIIPLDLPTSLEPMLLCSISCSLTSTRNHTWRERWVKIQYSMNYGKYKTALH